MGVLKIVCTHLFHNPEKSKTAVSCSKSKKFGLLSKHELFYSAIVVPPICWLKAF
jgi:hypothetical protein